MSNESTEPDSPSNEQYSLGAVTAALAFAGLAAQGGSFIVAQNYYRQFGIDALELGLSPLNAALRLTNTGIQIAGIMVATILLTTMISHVFKGSYSELAPYRRTLLLAAWAAVLVLSIVITSAEARYSAERLISQTQTNSEIVVHFFIESDYRASPVSVRWVEQEREPAAFALHAQATHVRTALLLGNNDSTYFLYFPNESVVVRVDLDHIVLESPSSP